MASPLGILPQGSYMHVKRIVMTMELQPLKTEKKLPADWVRHMPRFTGEKRAPPPPPP